MARDEQRQPREQDWFTYGGTVNAIAANGVATSSIQIEKDADFHAIKLTYFATIAGAAVTESSIVIPLIRVQITDGGSGRNLFNQALALPLTAGRGELPFLIPLREGRIFVAGSSVTISWSNYSAATTYNFDFGFVGVKKWY